MPTPSDSAAVPNSAVMKARLIAATLIDCIAAMPCAAGRPASPRMTKDENAKKTPATSPVPSAAARVVRVSGSVFMTPACPRLPGPSMTTTRRNMLDRPDLLDVASGAVHTASVDDPFAPKDPLGEALHFLRMSGTFYA